jgi:hypothetical protein
MVIKERHTIKKLNLQIIDKIDLDYYNTVYCYQFEDIKDVPDVVVECNQHVNTSSRIIFLCNHLNRYKKLSLEQIARRYQMQRRQIQIFIEAYREMENLNLIRKIV